MLCAMPKPDYVTRDQYLVLQQELDKGMTIKAAAQKAGMSQATAYRYRNDPSRASKPPNKGGRPFANSKILTEKKVKVVELLQAGHSIKETSVLVGISEPSARKIWSQMKGLKAVQEVEQAKADARLGPPKPYTRLKPEAQRALEDFTFFQRRYFGVIGHPWQAEAAETIARAVQSPEREFFVINVFPGSGKSSLFSCHIPAWLTAKDRAMRGMIGSSTARLAERHLLRLRRAFERTVPEMADADVLMHKTGFDADATLSEDFGRFKPAVRELWTTRDIVVEQLDQRGPLSEKEPTWAAFSIDSGFLGMRYPFIIWDDLVTEDNQRTSEKRDELQETWRKICETRLEPGGVMILMGQRLMADDLYRYVLDMQVPVDEEADPEAEGNLYKPKYKHICYKAHYEEKCAPGTHDRGALAYPNGCLLVPNRFSWRDCLDKMNDSDWLTVYQQQDVNPAEVLVNPDWIWGNDEFPGCIDKDRRLWEVPALLGDGDILAVATADPSPTNYWACMYWLYNPRNEIRYLVGLYRAKMDAPDFLDWNHEEGQFTGLMDQWQGFSESIGIPISTWVIEANACQRWLVQFDHFKRWQDRRGVEVIAHTTGRNKADSELGVETIAPHYRFGRVRLPYADEEARLASLKLIHEVTRYPHSRTDDCVMAHWFFEWNLPNIWRPKPQGQRLPFRPSWMRKTA